MYHDQQLISDIMVRLAVKDTSATDTELRLKALFAIRVERVLQSTLIQEDSNYAQSSAVAEHYCHDYLNTASEAVPVAQEETRAVVEDLHGAAGSKAGDRVGDEEAFVSGLGYPGGSGGNVAGSGGSQSDGDDTRAEEARPEATDRVGNINRNTR